MSKIVFFIETNAPITDAQRVILNLAVSAYKDGQDVVFLNNYQLEEADLSEDAKQIFELTSEVDFSKYEGAVFFTPYNYMLHLLAHISCLNDAKICLYSYDKRSVDWLISHFADGRCVTNIKNLLINTNALSFRGGNCVFANYDSDGREVLYIPPFIDESIEFQPQSVVNENVINIGVFGPFGAAVANMLTNLIRNMRVQKIDKLVKIHIIGKTSEMFNGKFSDCSTNYTNMIYTGEMAEEDYAQYIKKNVDIILAYGENAISAAKFGVPVVIPVIDAKPFEGNRYVYLFNAENHVFGWNFAESVKLDDDCVTFKTVLNDIYEKGLKQERAKQCFEFVVANASKAYALDSLYKQIEQSQLTLSDCLDNVYITKRLKQYFASTAKSFGEFIAVKAKPVENAKTPKKSVKKAILDNARVFIKKRKFFKLQAGYVKKVSQIIAKKDKNGKIKVAFIVVFKSVFPTRPIFEKMCADPNFDPYIVAAPNVGRTMKYQRDLYNDTFEGLKEEYGDRVIGGYDIANDKYYELKDEYSVIFFCNPYKHLVHPYHEIEYFLDKPVLPIYSSYGFAALSFWDEVIATDFYNYLWKACVETPSNLKHLQQVQTIKGKNGVVTGYIKADGLANVVPTPRDRKRILICPHHTVWGWKTLNISNFLTYCDLFVELPKMYPDIDFVFRPHPLLMDNLKAHKVWTQQQIDDYLARMLESPNITYDTSGDYYQQFVDSDAMIHDCGSFIGEYLYTEKPCCYMIKSEEETYKGLVPLGQQCMDQYYHAKSKEDIINFIENVVIKGNDPMKAQREAFVKNELKANYPHAADTMINMIKKELKIK